MKKFTKMLALGMAAALVFGMTVNAAPSVDTSAAEADTVQAVISANSVTDKDGKAVDVKVEASQLAKSVYNETFGTDYSAALDKATAAVKSALPKGDEVKDGKIVEISLTAGEMPEGGLWVPVGKAVEGAKGYAVAHWHDSKWNVLETEVRNDVVYALFTNGFSPVYFGIIPVGEDKGGNGGNGDNNNTTPTPSPTPESPKTGETLPIVGILAVICLAGAAVCAKKVRYNR